MDVERSSVHVLAESLCKSERLVQEVHVDLVAGDPLWSILPLLYQRPTVHSKVVEVEDPNSHTKTTVHQDYLPHAVDWLCHFTHQS